MSVFPGGYLYGQSVLVTDGDLSGCVARIREYVGIVRRGKQAHNVVEVVIDRRTFSLSEAFLRLTDRTDGATL